MSAKKKGNRHFVSGQPNCGLIKNNKLNIIKQVYETEVLSFIPLRSIWIVFSFPKIF